MSAGAATRNWTNTPNATAYAPGDTVQLWGYFVTQLTITNSGTAGNPITFVFQSGCRFQTNCWPETGAIQLNGKSYITIDGGGVGVIENTNNGTGLGTTNNSEGIDFNAASYFVTIQNLTITNIYRSIAGDAERLGYGIAMQGGSLTVSNCNLSDGDSPLVYSGPQPGTYATGSNIFIFRNNITDFNHGLTVGIGNGSAGPQNVLLTNMHVAGNWFGSSLKWDEASGSHHLDDIIILNNTYDPTVVMSGVYYYTNTFSTAFGVHNTAAIFNDIANPMYQSRNIYVFNNLFLASSNSWGNGFVSVGGTNVWVFNNTAYSASGLAGGSFSVGGPHAYCFNNIVESGAGVNLLSFTASAAGSDSGCTTSITNLTNFFADTWSDYNVFPGAAQDFGLQLDSNAGGHLWVIGAGFHTLANWQNWNGNSCPAIVSVWSATHADPHSSTGTPTRTGTYIPAVGDVVLRGTGTNLTSLGITTTDFNGVARPASGNWDIGAFQYAAPSGSSFTSLTAGQIIVR